jgi:hypothetical protein
MNSKSIVLAILVSVLSACGQSVEMDVFLSNFKEVQKLSPEMHFSADVSKYVEIGKDLTDTYLKGLNPGEFKDCSHLKFYAIENVKADAGFYILTLAIENNLKDKIESTILLVTVSSKGDVIGQIPLEGYWDKSVYDFKTMNDVKFDEASKKFTGVEVVIARNDFDQDFGDYALQGNAVMYVQNEGNIVQIEFFPHDTDFVEGGDDDFVEGDVIDVEAFLKQFKTLPYPVEVDHVNTPCYDGIVNMHDHLYDKSKEGDFSPSFRLPSSGSFHVVVMCRAGVPKEEASFSVFSISQGGVVISSMEIASVKQKGDDFIYQSAVFEKENQFTISESGATTSKSKYTFNPQGLIEKVN